MKRLIVRLSGGLGNQLFEYADALAVAEATGRRLLIDVGEYRWVRGREYGLDAFVGPAATARPAWLFSGMLTLGGIIQHFSMRWAARYFAAWGVRWFHYDSSQAADAFFGRVRAANDEIVYVSGCCVDAAVLPSRARLRREFAPVAAVEFAGERENSVAVHIRRGDYLQHAAGMSVLPERHYREAMAKLSAVERDLRWYFFSDDIGWCRKTFGDVSDAVFVEGDVRRPWRDLVKMSKCRHHVIANSTFSWWARHLSSCRLLVMWGTVAMALSASAVEGFGFRRHPQPLTHLTNACSEVRSERRLLKAGSPALPAKYDLRDEGGKTWLSPIRNQLPYGTCWAFATMAPLEYLLRKDEGIAADLSENNLINRHGYGGGFDDGGNYYMATAVLLREEAPTTEVLDPYPSIGASIREHGVRIPRKVVFVPARSAISDGAQFQADLTTIKRALMQYGPLPTSYGHYGAYLKGSAYYCPTAAEENHAVVIVGWDDDYPATNFRTQPSGNGAYIVRNSWGVTSGDCGYLYVSYYDRTLGFSGEVAFANLSAGDDYGHVYQHDRFGYVAAYGYESTSGSAANVFTATTNETLVAFGFYALSPNTTYSASIIVNPELSHETICGEAIPVASGTCAEAGYEVLPFTASVKVEAGDAFAILVSVDTPDSHYPLAFTANSEGYCSGVEAKPHLSYCRKSSWEKWEDASAEALYFCCKVYAAPQKERATTSTEFPVDKSWLERYSAQAAVRNCLSNCFYGCHNALAEHVAANGRMVADSFWLGLDPDNGVETNLLATVGLDGSGRPVVDVVPKNSEIWTYTVLGSENMQDWHLRAADDSFFKVRVSPR